MAKILAVEDNPAILDFYKDFFTEAGFDIQTAEDAMSAITRYQQFKPDLVILDLNIPAGGGMLVFETLRNRLADPVPIIFSTGKPEQLPNLEHIHNVAVVKKPADPEVLLAEVKRLLPDFFSQGLPQKFQPPPPPPNSQAAGAKILIVDDDLCVLDLYKEILAKSGFETETAEDAIGAITKFQEFKPALVILDVDMPAGGGKKVFERLRIQLASSTPIIFSTGSPESVMNLGKNLNVIILKKPLTPEILVQTVRQLLKLG